MLRKSNHFQDASLHLFLPTFVNFCSTFLPSDTAMLAQSWGRNSIRPSVTRVLFDKTKRCTADILIPLQRVRSYSAQKFHELRSIKRLKYDRHFYQPSVIPYLLHCVHAQSATTERYQTSPNSRR